MSLPLEVTNYQNSHLYSKIYFLFCESCFWCASYFVVGDNAAGGTISISSTYIGTNRNDSNYNNYTNVISKCPVCDKEKVESMPIANGESYRFDYNLERGVILEFLLA